MLFNKNQIQMGIVSMMDMKNKIVLICNNPVFLTAISKTSKKDCYIVEQADIIQNESALEKYGTNMKLAVVEANKWGNEPADLSRFIKNFKEDENFLFLLICDQGQQKLAVQAVRMGAIDVILMPCESEIIQKRVNNILRLLHLRQQVLRDPLTKIYNRAAFENAVRRLMKQEKAQAAFIMIDLDDFKYLNDTYGHDVGDMVLIRVARILTEVLDQKDVIGRMGGDEFAVFVPSIYSKENFLQKVEVIFSRLRIKFTKKGKEVNVSGSIGIAFFPEYGIDFNRLYRNADRAQYQSKNNGKHSIKIYGSDKTH